MLEPIVITFLTFVVFLYYIPSIFWLQILCLPLPLLCSLVLNYFAVKLVKTNSIVDRPRFQLISSILDPGGEKIRFILDLLEIKYEEYPVTSILSEFLR